MGEPPFYIGENVLSSDIKSIISKCLPALGDLVSLMFSAALVYVGVIMWVHSTEYIQPLFLPNLRLLVST